MRRELFATFAVLGVLGSTFTMPRAEAAPITVPASMRAATFDNGATEVRYHTRVRVPYGAYGAAQYGYGAAPYSYGGRVGGIPLGDGTATSPGGLIGGGAW